MISTISAKFLIGKLPSRCQDQRLRVTLRVADALQRSNDLVTGENSAVGSHESRVKPGRNGRCVLCCIYIYMHDCLKNKEMVY